MPANQIQHYLKHKHIIHSATLAYAHLISYTCMLHQQQTHPTSAAHTHPVAPHYATTHALTINTTHTPHQHPTHIYTYTLLTLSPRLMLKNKDLNFKALIQKTKTQSQSLSLHSTMSHALTHTHLYANQNQHHYCSALIALYKSKHNPISAKEKKNTKHCLFSPNSKEDPNHAKLKKSNLNPK